MSASLDWTTCTAAMSSKDCLRGLFGISIILPSKVYLENDH